MLEEKVPDDIPAGLPFSQAYLRPAVALKDDKRFRRRLSALFTGLSFPNHEMGQWLKYRGGIELQSGQSGWLWDAFFQGYPLEEVLDAIGFIFAKTKQTDAKKAGLWKSQVEKIFAEQAMAYRVDEACAVRRLVDAEFERTRVAAVAGLGLPKFKAAKLFFDKAVDALEQMPPDTAGMVRNTFSANEEVFNLMFGIDRLTALSVRDHLQPERLVPTHCAVTASQDMADSYAKWVDACQQYRHDPGQIDDGQESPAAPPLDLAIAMMSVGATFLRWLIARDKATGMEMGISEPQSN